MRVCALLYFLFTDVLIAMLICEYVYMVTEICKHVYMIMHMRFHIHLPNYLPLKYLYVRFYGLLFTFMLVNAYICSLLCVCVGEDE